MQLEKAYTKRVKVQITGLNGSARTDSITIMVYETTAREVEKLIREAVKHEQNGE